jgi:hypothetical protein
MAKAHSCVGQGSFTMAKHNGKAQWQNAQWQKLIHVVVHVFLSLILIQGWL